MTEQAKKGLSEPKSQRLELRLAPSARALIERAIELTGLTASDIVLRGARLVLDEHERMTLRGADREAFLQAVRNPPKPTARLREALRDHAKLGE